MNTLRLLLAWSVLCGALPATDAPTALAKPNILWIVMDDVGAELPCYGEKKIQTPNIDRLVREGTRFDRAFLTASVCSPSRSAMITGMYQRRLKEAQTFIDGNKEKYEKDRAAFEKEQAKARERLEKANK